MSVAEGRYAPGESWTINTLHLFLGHETVKTHVEELCRPLFLDLNSLIQINFFDF